MSSASESAKNPRSMSKRIFDYLDTCKRSAIENLKPAEIYGLPQYADISPKLISDYLKRYKVQHPYFGDKKSAENPQNPQRNSATPVLNSPPSILLKKSIQIGEEDYLAYLHKCIDGDGDVRIAAEIRGYLDKTKALAQQKNSIMDVDAKVAEILMDEPYTNEVLDKNHLPVLPAEFLNDDITASTEESNLEGSESH